MVSIRWQCLHRIANLTMRLVVLSAAGIPKAIPFLDTARGLWEGLLMQHKVGKGSKTSSKTKSATAFRMRARAR